MDTENLLQSCTLSSWNCFESTAMKLYSFFKFVFLEKVCSNWGGKVVMTFELKQCKTTTAFSGVFN